ncbi:hypothetical protein QTP86_017241 [Hemibagrus guttatus]|nr:hypothetical protein QTP86_017241 [Hemibagrus guttatus]
MALFARCVELDAIVYLDSEKARNDSFTPKLVLSISLFSRYPLKTADFAISCCTPDDRQTRGMKVGVLIVIEDDDHPTTLPSVINFAVVLEEAIVLQDAPVLQSAVAYLFGLLFALDFYVCSWKWALTALQGYSPLKLNFYYDFCGIEPQAFKCRGCAWCQVGGAQADLQEDISKNITGPLLDPLHFAYRANRSVDDAVNMGLHFILQHLEKSGTYVRLLFVDFSSAFNTIIPTLLQNKLTQLSVPSSIYQCITSFLTDRHQLVKLGKFTSYSRTTSTGAPQGCVLFPLLFSLYTNDCTSTDPSVKLLKFADDTTVISLIQDGDESAYRQEVEQLPAWCSLNNLELNTLKTVEMIVDFRRNIPALPPLTIMNSTVPTVESFRFLGTTISQDLKWVTHIDSIIKKAQQR